MAEMWKVIIKNNDASDYLIEDLGISVVASGSISFHEQFTYDEIAGSDDLRDAVSGSSLVVNDGSEDLAADSGADYLSLENLYHLGENYYDKTEVDTISGALDAAKSDIDHLHDDRYYTETELDAGQLDNRYYTEAELDAGQLDNRYYTETELQTSGQSSVHWGNITNAPDMMPNALDDAYDEGGAGVGRTITVDAGAVKLDATSSGNAPIELTEQSTLPTLDLAGGQLSVKGGILYVYDSVRSKWLSVQRMFLTFGKKGKTKDQFLAFGAGELYSNNSGYRLARNATIVAITGQLDASGTCDMRIRRNDSATNITTLNISSAIGNSDTTPNVDLSANDYLQSYLESVAGAEDPVVVVELAWRE